MHTDSGPMRNLQQLAAAQVGREIVEAVFGGCPYADTPDVDASALVVSDVGADSSGAAALARFLWRLCAVRRMHLQSVSPRQRRGWRKLWKLLLVREGSSLSPILMIIPFLASVGGLSVHVSRYFCKTDQVSARSRRTR
ncbi:hypothetical protein ACM41_12840 [Bradyrhizobium sp. CCBAU 21362]|uniref:M81 family metallopeptidase n=1 Tax=Bradyrhizobium sp. CCBAU 21362 TaxID=1325082 RepID=UPI003FA4922D|nr:hypothetical protein [Bradyrhizobium sp. CCBAU 21362]